ncbi:interleukin-17 receptor E-like protein [Chiloscyllium punctatum]
MIHILSCQVAKGRMRTKSGCLSSLLIILSSFISCCPAVENNTKCGLRCSQGLQCISKNLTFNVQHRYCREPPSSLPSKVLEDLKIFAVLKCRKERQCSIHLKAKGALILNEHIRGVEMCSLSMTTFRYQCVIVKFNKHGYKKFIGHPVQIEYDCFSAEMEEYTQVTLKTIPYYCDAFIQQEYQVGDCTDKDIGKSISTCIAGKLDYVIDKKQKSLSVQVSEIVEDLAYHVRLCHKWFICEDVGISALIKVQDSKEVTLPYSRILPCLCIEGWSALPDARRVQLCPFKNYTAELWNGITYDHVSQELAWEQVCPMEVSVNLCWMTRSSDHCIDLQNSFHKRQHKVRYSRVDPNPRLCVKFTTNEGVWVRCPFAFGYSPAWNMTFDEQYSKLQFTFKTLNKAEFKMALCNRSAPHECDPLKELQVTANTVGAYTRVFNLSQEEYDSNFCIQGWRTDVEYSVRIQFCDIMWITELKATGTSSAYTWTVAIFMILVILLTVILVAGYMFCRALHRPYRKVVQHSSQSSKRMSVDIQEASPL